MTLELLAIGGAIASLVIFVTTRASSLREEAWQKMTERLVAGHNDTMERAIMAIKAQSVEQAVHAETLRKSHDIQLQQMQDTISEEKAVEEEKDSTPYKLQTADGREIDLREWEVVG